MEKILNCIDEYIKDLEKQVLETINDTKTSMIEKNSIMEPLSEQKKLLTLTKEAMINIKNREYSGGCTMWKEQL